MHIVHVYIQCLLRVDGNILAGVFLTSSFFCVVPESSYSSNAAINSLLAAWSSNCSSAANSSKSIKWWLHSKPPTLKEAVAETGGCSAPAHFMWTTIGFTEKLSADFVPTKLSLLSRKTPLQQQFYSK